MTQHSFSLNTGLLTETLKKEKIYSCLISVDNKPVYHYFKNKKMEKKQHKINSCTKSVTSCLIGIAHDQGYIPDLDTPISAFFPAVADMPDERKRAITLDHLLTMTAGFDWPELGEWGGWPQMIHSSNWVKYVLERPLLTEPGQSMNYNSGCGQLLLATLQKATGATAQEFAVRHLFAPLGFDDFIWHVDPQGVNIGGFGLHMTVQDMHKFGSLYLNRGRWGNKQVVSEAWIDRTTQPVHLTYHDIGHYGRHWWASHTEQAGWFHFAMGMGGQYICVVPSLKAVISLTSDTYGDTLKPLQIIKSVIL